MSPNQTALLEFIRKEHAVTGAPVTHGQMVMANIIPSRFLVTTRAALMRAGRIRVPVVGVAEWEPTQQKEA